MVKELENALKNQMKNDAKEMGLSIKKWKQENAIKAMFASECLYCKDFKKLPIIVRWFYMFKVFVCLKLGRMNGSYLNENFEVKTWGHTYYMETKTWQCIWVEVGLFKNWNVCVGDDGT